LSFLPAHAVDTDVPAYAGSNHMPVTINNLDVRFDVEGEGDEAVFARLFAKYAKQWTQQNEEAEARKKRSDCERSLGDRHQEDS